jgi:hypothetical protein
MFELETKAASQKMTFQPHLPHHHQLTVPKEERALKNVNNGKQSTVNKSLDGSMYPG